MEGNGEGEENGFEWMEMEKGRKVELSGRKWRRGGKWSLVDGNGEG